MLVHFLTLDGWRYCPQAQLNLVELLDYAFQACRAAAPKQAPARSQGPSQQEALLSATLLLIQAVRLHMRLYLVLPFCWETAYPAEAAHVGCLLRSANHLILRSCRTARRLGCSQSRA